jgi:heptosyltransferase-2
LTKYFASFQQIVSYLYDPDGVFEANLRRAGVKNILSAYQRIDDSEHAAEQLARPLQKLALYLEDHAARIFPSDADRAVANRFLNGYQDLPIVAMHPGSGSAKKNWALERWVELGWKLVETRPATRLLLIGGEADQIQIEELTAAWNSLPLIIARDLPLPHLAAVIERCRLFVGHDSGISHLAAAVGTPCLLLFGPTDPSVWAPANPAVSVLEAPDGELSAFSVETVGAKAAELLG